MKNNSAEKRNIQRRANQGEGGGIKLLQKNGKITKKETFGTFRGRQIREGAGADRSMLITWLLRVLAGHHAAALRMIHMQIQMQIQM